MLRSATEEDIIIALYGSKVRFPIKSPADAVELFNSMLDTIDDADED